MVRILANGDIVADDDPRVITNQPRSRAPSSGSAGHGYFDQQRPQHQQGAAVQGPTVFDTWNQKLLDLGIPRWNIGDHVVEPIMTVLVLLTVVFLGFQGLVFLGILYFVVKFSQRSQTQSSNPSDGPPGPNRRPSNLSRGYRLGR